MRYNTIMERLVDILLIEDDADINEVIATFLRRQGFSCTQAFSGSEARLALQGRIRSGARPFNLILTDLMLPGLTGRELIELVRNDGDVPIIVVSARAAPLDKVDVLSIGADDYLVKPFDLDELLARIQVQLRHAAKCSEASFASAENALHYKDWIVDSTARTLIAADEPVQLTRLEFNIVEALARHPRKAFTKRELFETAWAEECFIEEKAVNVHISNIRAKLKPSGTDGYIETVWGIGFKLAE